jgi:hypothetical protein
MVFADAEDEADNNIYRLLATAMANDNLARFI